MRPNTINQFGFSSLVTNTLINTLQIGIIEQMVAYCAENSPIPEGITAEEVGSTAAFLASPLASGITGTTIYVDKGYHSMGMAVDRPVLAKP